VESPKKSEFNFWPYAILGMILTVVLLGVWTVKIAIKNPVQEETRFMMKYQDVDENINEILAKQKQFDAKYRVDLSQNRLQLGENRVKISLRDQAGHPIEAAKIVAIITRPTTSKEDVMLKHFEKMENGIWVSEPFVLERGGRWNIEVKIEVGDDTGYKTYKTFVKSL